MRDSFLEGTPSSLSLAKSLLFSVCFTKWSRRSDCPRPFVAANSRSTVVDERAGPVCLRGQNEQEHSGLATSAAAPLCHAAAVSACRFGTVAREHQIGRRCRLVLLRGSRHKMSHRCYGRRAARVATLVCPPRSIDFNFSVHFSCGSTTLCSRSSFQKLRSGCPGSAKLWASPFHTTMWRNSLLVLCFRRRATVKRARRLEF
jgi:hypothetical protein